MTTESLLQDQSQTLHINQIQSLHGQISGGEDTIHASTIVVDIGKTLSKVTAWTAAGELVDRQVRPNEIVTSDGMRRLDVDGIAAWLIEALARFADHPIKRIIPVAHGAGVVALSGTGPDASCLIKPLDYEQDFPADLRRNYENERDPFARTGSPALPSGLNLGMQIYWMEHAHPEKMQGASLVPWAQYWAWHLSGAAVTETTSLGCHTDLWLPDEHRYSKMAIDRGWADRFAPLSSAGDVIGNLRAEIAKATGLPQEAQVLVGLHDSNAALLAARGFPEISGNEATVLSTGTWFIAMRLPLETITAADLSEGRDTLLNVDAYGNPVPSARFMGGREIESVIEIDTRQVDIRPDQPLLVEAVPGLLERGTMMLPTLARGYGPYPHCEAEWVDRPVQWKGTWYARRAAICLYAALVTDTCLDLIDTKERLLVEGRFAEAEVFVRALAALRPDLEVYVANEHNDVSFGALRLADPSLVPRGGLRRVSPLAGDLISYREKWRERVGSVLA